MNTKKIITRLSCITVTFLSAGIQAHNDTPPRGETDLLTAITVEEKTGWDSRPGASNHDNVFGEKFVIKNNNTSKSGFTHYLEMRGRANRSGPSSIKTNIRDSIHSQGRVRFHGDDTINNISFSCTVYADSNIFDTAVHAATNFKDGAYLTVMRRIDSEYTGTLNGIKYRKGECFYIKLSYNDKYKPSDYIDADTRIPGGGTIVPSGSIPLPPGVSLP